MHKEKARDAASVTNKWLTKLKTKSERGKNKNAKAADKVTEMFWFYIQAGCDVQGMKTLFRKKKYFFKNTSFVNQDLKAMMRARFDFCFSSAGSVLLVPRAPRRAGEPSALPDCGVPSCCWDCGVEAVRAARAVTPEDPVRPDSRGRL